MRHPWWRPLQGRWRQTNEHTVGTPLLRKASIFAVGVNNQPSNACIPIITLLYNGHVVPAFVYIYISLHVCTRIRYALVIMLSQSEKKLLKATEITNILVLAFAINTSSYDCNNWFNNRNACNIEIVNDGRKHVVYFHFHCMQNRSIKVFTMVFSHPTPNLQLLFTVSKCASGIRASWNGSVNPLAHSELTREALSWQCT